jgi:hypothetical protein
VILHYEIAELSFCSTALFYVESSYAILNRPDQQTQKLVCRLIAKTLLTLTFVLHPRTLRLLPCAAVQDKIRTVQTYICIEFMDRRNKDLLLYNINEYSSVFRFEEEPFISYMRVKFQTVNWRLRMRGRNQIRN